MELAKGSNVTNAMNANKPVSVQTTSFMESKKEELKISNTQPVKNHMDATIYTSPIPQACSTGRKYKQRPNCDLSINRQSVINEEPSVGILRLSDISDANDSKLLISDRYMKDIEILNRRHSKYGKQPPANTIPSNLFQTSEDPHTPPAFNNESTISESDFSNPQLVPRFTPSARSSSLSGTFFQEESRRLKDMLTKLEDQDTSIDEIIEKYFEESNKKGNMFDDLSYSLSISAISEDFIPGENAVSKLRADEMSWYREKNSGILPTVNASNMTVADNFDRGQSIGEYFWKNTEPLTNLSLQSSPEKRYPPMKLIDEPTIDASQLTANDESKIEDSINTSSNPITLSMIQRAMPLLKLKDSPKTILKKLPEEFKKPTVPPLPKRNRNFPANSDEIKRKSSIISGSFVNALNDVHEAPTKDVTKQVVRSDSRNKENGTDRLSSTLKIEDFGAKLLSAKISNDVLADASNLMPKNNSPCAIGRTDATSGYSSKSRNESPLLLKSGGNFTSPTISSMKSPTYTETGSLDSASCSELEFSGGTDAATSPCPTPFASAVVGGSSRSSSTASVQSLVGGKLPIQTTRQELVWECVKVGKTVTQEFILRNRSDLRLRLTLSVTGNAFRIHKSGQEFVHSLSIVMHPSESRTVTVAFSPDSCRAFCEKLFFVFNPSSSGYEKRCRGLPAESGKRQTIYCSGYGGYAHVDVANVTKDSGGRMWMLLGQIGQRSPLRCSFVVKNTGNLAAFAAVQLSTKMQHYLNDLNSTVRVEPMECVLRPKEERTVTVTLAVNNDDYRAFFDHCRNGNVIDVGYFSIVTGAEITRARLRRLFKKMMLNNSYDSYFDFINKEFPNENVPQDITILREPLNCKKHLLKGVMDREISVTVEMDPDLTIMPPLDDTTAFKSLYDESTIFAAATRT